MRNESLFVPATHIGTLYREQAGAARAKRKLKPSGRICAVCPTILSRYNAEKLCAIHTPTTPRTTNSRHRKDAA